jgi:hypothetical protein
MIEAPAPHRISEALLMLCEGGADNEFFRRLLRAYNLPKFAFPFPPIGQEGAPGPPLYGRDGFINMLKTLNNYFDLDPSLATRTKGILIALDAANDASASFRHARGQIQAAGNFGIPSQAGEIANSQNRPPVSIITVPLDVPGSLESLCVEAVKQAHPEYANCMETFFECCPTDYSAWNPEGYDKARLRCLVAATYQPDPSRSTSLLFANRNAEPPAIDIQNAVFKPLADAIQKFCRDAGA